MIKKITHIVTILLLLIVGYNNNSYAQGQKKIIQSLKSAGCKNFFVAQLSEGIILRKLFKNIHINVLNDLLKVEVLLDTKNKTLLCQETRVSR